MESQTIDITHSADIFHYDVTSKALETLWRLVITTVYSFEFTQSYFRPMRTPKTNSSSLELAHSPIF